MIWNNAQTKRIAKVLEKMAGKKPNTKYDDAIKRIADSLEYMALNGGFGGKCQCHDKIVQDYYTKEEFDELVLNLLRGDPEILGLTELIIEEGESLDNIDFMEGITAIDYDGTDITSDVIITGTVDPDIAGEYELKYAVTDSKGKATIVTRKVVIQEWKIEDYATVLFEDGHLMINEKKSNREADIAIHGAVKEEYTPWDKKNPETSYVFEGYGKSFWNDSRSLITSCSAGSTFKPKHTDYMFVGCSDLTTLDFSNWDTSVLYSAVGMFNNCKSLTTLDVSNWDTSALVNADSMFSFCGNLTTVDVSSWDTSALEDAYAMFYSCSSLTTLDVSNWDTSSLQKATSMFQGCYKSLTTLDVSNWDTSALQDANGMFYDCRSLTTLDVSNWDTSALEDASFMFAYCSSLTTLNVSNWDTSALKYASGMFYGCQSLTTLDVSNWDTSVLENVYHMFSDCKKLETIYVSDKFVTSEITFSENMFLDSTTLVGGAGTTYDSSKTDKEYARIDDPDNGKPGYFTAKS